MAALRLLLYSILLIQFVSAIDPIELCSREKIVSHTSFCLGIKDNKTSWEDGGCTPHEGNECDLWITAKKFNEKRISWIVFILGFNKWRVEFVISNRTMADKDFWDGSVKEITWPFYHPILMFNQNNSTFDMQHIFEDDIQEEQVYINGAVSQLIENTLNDKWETFEIETDLDPTIQYEFIKNSTPQYKKWQLNFELDKVFFHVAQFDKSNIKALKNWKYNIGFNGEGVNILTFVPPEIIRPPIRPPPYGKNETSGPPGSQTDKKSNSIWIWLGVAITILFVVIAIIIFIYVLVLQSKAKTPNTASSDQDTVDTSPRKGEEPIENYRKRPKNDDSEKVVVTF